MLATASRTLLTASTIEAPAAAGRAAAALSSSSTASSSSAAGFASAVGRRALWEAPQHSHFARTAASSATDAADPEEGEESVLVTDAAVQRLRELVEEDGSKPVLRVSVSAGGCSGFQYQFDLVEDVGAEDRVFERDGVKVVADDVSYSFIKGSKIHFEDDLIRSAFVIADNPLAESSCGCGSSFAAKM